MSEEEKARFLSNIKYYWQEKGDIERYSDYTPEALREADPVLASAYENYKIATETINRLLDWRE
jgi:hypothetical protein